MGRPKKKDEDRLDAQIPAARVRQEERDAFEAAALASGVKLSDWIRNVLIAAANADKIKNDGGGKRA